jgi:hypothetical protein
MRRPPLLPILALAALGAAAPSARAQRAAGDGAPPALAAITEADLRRDVFAQASDTMRGREAGTLDELRAAGWLAERARAAGLQPAGDDGTYFQWWPMRRVRVDDRSRAALDGAALALWRDAAVVAPVDSALDLPLVWIGTAGGDSLGRLDLRGKAVAARLLPPARPPVEWVSLRAWRAARLALAERTAALTAAGAAAVVLVADAPTDSVFATLATQMRRGVYAVDSAGADVVAPRLPVLLVPAAAEARVRRRAPPRARAARRALRLPERQRGGTRPGTDARLRDGARARSAATSTTTACATRCRWAPTRGAASSTRVARRRRQRHGERRAARHRARLRARARPAHALFVWHGAEERGLLGSRWHARTPRCRAPPRAVLNADMLGRNHPDTGRPARRAAAAPQLDGAGGDGARRQRARVALRRRHVVGPADAPRGLVLPQRPPARTRGSASRR